MPESDAIWIGDWRLDPLVRSLTKGAVEERIEPKMVDVLLVLVEQAGSPVRRADLEREVWSGAAVGTELLSRTIWKLRKVLGDDPASPAYIETIPRVGYRLVAPVGNRPPAAPAAADPFATADPTAPRAPWAAADHPAPTGPPAPAAPAPAADRPGSRVLVAAGAVVIAMITLGVVLKRAVDPDGASRSDLRIVPLTASPGYEAAPSLSADGRFVAFQRYDPADAAPTWDIAILEIESGAVRTLVADPRADEYGPVWSPGGDSIAFIRQDDGCEIRIQALDGGSIKAAACAPDQGHEIAWDADGSLILSSTGKGQTLGIVRIDREGGTPVPLTAPPVGFDGDLHPRPSPDGRTLAFVRQRTGGISDVYLVDRIDPGEPRRLTRDHRRIGDLAWTPDGSAIVFSSMRGGDSRLWRQSIGGGPPTVVPMSGRNADRISIGSDSVLVYEEYFGDSDIWVYDPATGTSQSWAGSSRSEWGVTVSPDRRTVAFLSDRTGSAEVWTMSVDGGEARRLTRLDGAQVDPPHWSPDSRTLAFAAAPDGDFDVFTIDVAEGTLHRVTNDPRDERTPDWWGESLVFTANRTGTPELWSVPAAGGTATRLTLGGAGVARATPDGRSLYFTRPDEPGLWELTGHGTPALAWRDLDPSDWANWVPTDDGLLYLRIHGSPAPQLERIDFARGRSDTLAVVAAEAPSQAGIDLTADGRIFFTRVVRSESDLWIAHVPGSF